MNKTISLENNTDLYINGEIGNDFIAKDFINQLSGLANESALNLHIYSGGGCLFDALSVVDHLILKGYKTNCYISGLAGSAATVIASACDKVYIGANSFYFIHNPISDNKDLKDKAAETLVNIYKKKTGLPKEKIRSLLANGDNGDFLTAKEALALGFVDEIFNEMKLAAHKPYEFSNHLTEIRNNMEIKSKLDALEASIKKLLKNNADAVVDNPAPIEDAPKEDPMVAYEKRVASLEMAVQEIIKKMEEMVDAMEPVQASLKSLDLKANVSTTKVVNNVDPSHDGKSKPLTVGQSIVAEMMASKEFSKRIR